MGKVQSAEEFMDPIPPARLSRRNVLALTLSVAGVLLVLFFSSRRSKSVQPAFSPADHYTEDYSVLEPILPRGPIYDSAPTGPRKAAHTRASRVRPARTGL